MSFRATKTIRAVAQRPTIIARTTMAPKTSDQQQRRARTSSAPAESNSNSSPKPLYASQHLLPHLPVPSLSSTFNKYLETLQPHLDQAGLSRNTSHVKEFLQSPLSSTLQARLEARASERESWLSEWWNEAAYMSYRDSIVPNVNYFYLHRQGLAKGASQTRRAAELVRGARIFRDLVTTEKLEPESIKSKPLDASAYPALFNASRIPTKPSDTFEIYPAGENEHVVVLRKDRLFKVQTKGLGVGDLEGAFQQVIKLADAAEGQAISIGTLTGEDRDVWTEARDHLVSLSPKNAEILKTVQAAIVLVNLDDTVPAEGREGRSWNLYTGDGTPGRNRWFDKHEFVVDPKGESGFNGEHSMLDGTPTLRMNEFVLAALENGKIPLDLAEGERPGKVQVEPLEFVVDDKVHEFVKKAQKNFADSLSRHDLKVVQFEQYGKDAIKKHKVSPDAWVQMVKQLAYGKMTGGKPAVTYESAQTRKFRLGRTEVIRSASAQSKAFVDAMLDPNGSDVERAKLFRAAAGRHIQYATWAADGQGVDRHMFGLKKLLRKGEEMPEVFKDEAFALSSTWTLSTSNLTSEYLDNWGYGQVVSEGFGLSYSISDHYLRWSIMTTTGKADELKKNLIWAAEELRKTMDNAAKSDQAGAPKAKL